MDAFDVMMTALRFNEAINQRNLEGFVTLLTEDHVFIDNFGHIDTHVAEGWHAFFTKYPDSRNVFTFVTVHNDVAVMIGYSTCTKEPHLNGPSMWTAKVRDGRVAEWRVYWLDRR